MCDSSRALLGEGSVGQHPWFMAPALDVAAAIDKLPQCSISATALWRPPEALVGAGGGCGLGGLWGGGAHAAAPTLPTGSLGNSSGVLKGLSPSHLRDIPSSIGGKGVRSQVRRSSRNP